MTTADRLPSVSVVIPTHERPGFLRRAVRSVIEQDYASRVQTLVVFDGCEPAAIPASDSPGQRAVVVLGNARTLDALGARNTGILAADGDVVAFLDDHDEWLPSKLSRQVEVLMSGSADVVFSGVRFIAGDRQQDYVPRRPAHTIIICTAMKRLRRRARERRSLAPDLLDESFQRGVTRNSRSGSCSGSGRDASPSRSSSGAKLARCPRSAFDAPMSLDTLQALHHRLFWRRVSA
jgi:glycosyltransferase involved in cell wall biosynthesis